MPAQLPLVWLITLALMAAAAAIVAVGPAVWFLTVRRLVRGEPVLEHEPRRLATWGFIDLVLVVVLTMIALVGLAFLVRQVGGINIEAAAEGSDNQGRLYLMLISAVGQLIAVGLTGGFIVLRTGCSLRDLGLTTEHLTRDLKLGAAAFCALAIPTFGLQAILTQFWPSAHPLIESLKVDGGAQFLAVGMFAAVIAAPLSEEFVFRVLFQGWLEKMFDPAAIFRPNYFASLLAGVRIDSDRPAVVSDVVAAELVEPAAPRSIYLGPPPITDVTPNPYVSPVASPEPAADQSPWQVANSPHWITDVVPISVSAALFAIMHFSHGPDFIPLFFLALGMGYLYRRTHRITPSLVVHFLLNLISMLMLCAAIYGEKVVEDG